MALTPQERAELINDIVNNKTPRHLDLSNRRISDDDVRTIMNKLRTDNTVTTSVNLSGNWITNLGGYYIAGILDSPSSGPLETDITEINLSGNAKIADQYLQRIQTVLDRNKLLASSSSTSSSSISSSTSSSSISSSTSSSTISSSTSLSTISSLTSTITSTISTITSTITSTISSLTSSKTVTDTTTFTSSSAISSKSATSSLVSKTTADRASTQDNQGNGPTTKNNEGTGSTTKSNEVTGPTTKGNDGTNDNDDSNQISNNTSPFSQRADDTTPLGFQLDSTPLIQNNQSSTFSSIVTANNPLLTTNNPNTDSSVAMYTGIAAATGGIVLVLFLIIIVIKWYKGNDNDPETRILAVSNMTIRGYYRPGSDNITYEVPAAGPNNGYEKLTYGSDNNANLGNPYEIPVAGAANDNGSLYGFGDGSDYIDVDDVSDDENPYDLASNNSNTRNAEDTLNAAPDSLVVYDMAMAMAMENTEPRDKEVYALASNSNTRNAENTPNSAPVSPAVYDMAGNTEPHDKNVVYALAASSKPPVRSSEINKTAGLLTAVSIQSSEDELYDNTGMDVPGDMSLSFLECSM